jgi:hypothetical protein
MSAAAVSVKPLPIKRNAAVARRDEGPGLVVESRMPSGAGPAKSGPSARKSGKSPVSKTSIRRSCCDQGPARAKQLAKWLSREYKQSAVSALTEPAIRQRTTDIGILRVLGFARGLAKDPDESFQTKAELPTVEDAQPRWSVPIGGSTSCCRLSPLTGWPRPSRIPGAAGRRPCPRG